MQHNGQKFSKNEMTDQNVLEHIAKGSKKNRCGCKYYPNSIGKSTAIRLTIRIEYVLTNIAK